MQFCNAYQFTRSFFLFDFSLTHQFSTYLYKTLLSSMWGGYGDTFFIIPLLSKETIRIWYYRYHVSHRMMDSNGSQLILCMISVSRVLQLVFCLLMYCFLLLLPLKSINSLHWRWKNTWGMLIFHPLIWVNPIQRNLFCHKAYLYYKVIDRITITSELVSSSMSTGFSVVHCTLK